MARLLPSLALEIKIRAHVPRTRQSRAAMTHVLARHELDPRIRLAVGGNFMAEGSADKADLACCGRAHCAVLAAVRLRRVGRVSATSRLYFLSAALEVAHGSSWRYSTGRLIDRLVGTDRTTSTPRPSAAGERRERRPWSIVRGCACIFVLVQRVVQTRPRPLTRRRIAQAS